MKMNWFAQASIASYSLHCSLRCICSALFRVRTNNKYKKGGESVKKNISESCETLEKNKQKTRSLVTK